MGVITSSRRDGTSEFGRFTPLGETSGLAKSSRIRKPSRIRKSSRPSAPRWMAVVAALTLALSGCDREAASEAPVPQEKPQVQVSAPAEEPQSQEQPQSQEPPQPEESKAEEFQAEETETKLTDTSAYPPGEITQAVVTSITDGDTIKTDLGSVRIIGIDTPEQGECGFQEATALMEDMVAPGDRVALVLPQGQNDHDKYDRLIRYVITAEGVDVGLAEIEAGYAVARYDSSDGYPEHPREQEYRAAQRATLTAERRVEAVGCEGTSYVSNTNTNTAENEDKWWTQYSSCRKLKQNTNGHPTGPFNRDDPAEAEIYNWFQYETGHRGDGDGDGLACE